MTLRQKIRIGRTLGSFAHVVAQQEAGDTSKFNLLKESWVSMNIFDQPHISAALGDSFDFCKREVESFIKRAQNKKPVMSHLDLNAYNVLIDARVGKVTGIIDFGDFYTHYPERGGIGNCLDPLIEKAAWYKYASLGDGRDIRDHYCIKFHDALANYNGYGKSLIWQAVAELKQAAKVQEKIAKKKCSAPSSAKPGGYDPC